MAEERRQITLKVRKTVMWDLESLLRSEGTSLPFKEWIADFVLVDFVKYERRRRRSREKRLEKLGRQRQMERIHEWALVLDTQWEMKREAEERKRQT